MLIHLHKQATTTPKNRTAIQASDAPASVLAERFGTTEQTLYKWRHRDSVDDRSHAPHRLQTTLTPAQEAVAVALRAAVWIAIFAIASFQASAAAADHPQVRDATAEQRGAAWRISVTLAHPDTGWDHYADGWEILDAQGNRLGYRKLHHPHVNEQPFTRSLSNVEIPDDTRRVFIRPHCSVDGWAPTATPLDISP